MKARRRLSSQSTFNLECVGPGGRQQRAAGRQREFSECAAAAAVAVED